MWKPHYVVTEHKTRAKLVWAVMLIAMVAYTIYRSRKKYIEHTDPETSYDVSNKCYQFPYMEVCLQEGNGCDADVDACLGSVEVTVESAGKVWKVQEESPEESSNCVTLNLDGIELEESSCLEGSDRPNVSVQMVWIASQDADIEATYSSRVAVYLGGSDVKQKTWVPYSRIAVPVGEGLLQADTTLTDMTIGKSVREYLSKDSVTSYPTLTLSSTDATTLFSYNVPEFSTTSGRELLLGDMVITLTLGPDSFTTLSDDEPISWWDFLSLLGGAWALVGTAWGLLFIATNDSKPEEKGRNFKKDVEKGKNFIKRKISLPIRGVASDAEGTGEEQPNWDIAHGGPLSATENTNGGSVS